MNSRAFGEIAICRQYILPVSKIHYRLSHIYQCRRKFHSGYNCHMTQAAETENMISDTCPELTSSSVAAAAVFWNC